jgi:transposase
MREICMSGSMSPAIRRAIRSAGAKLFYLPLPYSPDLNPIEQAFSKLKTLLGKENARWPEEVARSIGELLSRLTPLSAMPDTRQPEATVL